MRHYTDNSLGGKGAGSERHSPSRGVCSQAQGNPKTRNEQGAGTRTRLPGVHSLFRTAATLQRIEGDKQRCSACRVPETAQQGCPRLPARQQRALSTLVRQLRNRDRAERRRQVVSLHTQGRLRCSRYACATGESTGHVGGTAAEATNVSLRTRDRLRCPESPRCRSMQGLRYTIKPGQRTTVHKVGYHHIDACRRRGQGTWHRCRTSEGECNSLNRSAVSARSGTQAPRNRGVLRGTQRG